ncbi:hypothetical protein D7V93_00045 [Corallococcus llansteffanensis]|uniref:Uncharacterized protein n=2 Tax=Corallococcus llansteffanensis TaxID=2316731 RepID=A0A3A8QQG7_9BACT|nr:hypothetical protein D7V93_00045 [Corallococcus llansteffanensis]
MWKAAFALEGSTPAPRAAAESVLLQGGATAYGVLSKLARVGGRAQVMAAAGPLPTCVEMMHYRSMAMMRGSNGPRLPGMAAELAGRLLMKDDALRRRVQTSEDPFDRGLALAAVTRSPELQVQALAAMRKEPEPWLRMWAGSLANCFTRTAEKRGDGSVEALRVEAKYLAEQAEDVRAPLRCVEPAELEPTLVDELATEQSTAGGWSSSGEVMQVNVQRANGDEVSLSPACALAAYDALVTRGKHVDSLVQPVATHLQSDWRLRQAAGQRAARDLEHLPEFKRNRAAAELVNAGHDVPLKVTWKEERGYWSREEVEAAMRQGNPDAKAALDRLLFCRNSSGQNEMSLLGYLGTKKAAETAYAIAQRCPDAQAAATAALVRLKDPRAAKFLPQALEQWGSDQEALRRALLDAYTPKLGQQLLALEAKGLQQAREMVKLLKSAGVMKQ